jgi:hypothetical protein
MDTEKTKAKKPRYVWSEVDNVAESTREKKRGALDLHENALFIEFLERGDFHRHLSKAAVKRRVFPDMLLWELFECCWSPLESLGRKEDRLTSACSVSWRHWTSIPEGLSAERFRPGHPDHTTGDRDCQRSGSPRGKWET